MGYRHRTFKIAKGRRAHGESVCILCMWGFQENKAWPEGPASAWVWMAVLARDWGVGGVLVSGSTDIPVPWLGDPPDFGHWGKYSCPCTPAFFFALLKGDFAGVAFPHIGVGWPSGLDMCFASDSAPWMILANSLELWQYGLGPKCQSKYPFAALCPQWVEVPWWPCRKEWMVEGRKVWVFQGHGPILDEWYSPQPTNNHQHF